MIYKLTAPNDITGFVGGHLEHDRRVRIILGVAYTGDQELARWAEARGYTTEIVDRVPDDYLDARARLEAWPTEISGFAADGADPDAKYRFTGPDGQTQIDIRDVINGVVTA